jgi:hypothetical protein
MKNLVRSIATLVITTLFITSASACGFLNLFSSKKPAPKAPKETRYISEITE